MTNIVASNIDAPTRFLMMGDETHDTVVSERAGTTASIFGNISQGRLIIGILR